MKTSNTNLYIIYTFIISLFLFSCEENETFERRRVRNLENIHELYHEDEDGQSELYNMPLASVTELDSYGTEIDNNEGFIPYRLARQYAFIEFMANARTFLPEYAWTSVLTSICAGESIPIALTNRPAIVYNYDDTPYYYEFGVIMGEQLLTVITVYAHKMSDQLIAFVGAACYKENDFRHKRYVGMYPSVYYANFDMSYSIPVYNADNERFEMQEVGNPAPLYTNPMDILQEKLYSIPQEELVLMNEDLSQTDIIETEDGETVIPASTLAAYQTKCLVLNDSVQATLNRRLTNLSNDTILNTFYLSSYQKNLVDSILLETQSNTFFLPEYDNYQLRFTHWSGYCGPAAMAWLYRGKWDFFRGVYLPIYGDGFTYSENINFNYSWYGDYAYYNVSSANCERYGDSNERYSWIMMSMEYDNGLCGAWYAHCWSMFDGQALFEGGLRDGLEYVTDDKENRYTIKFTIAPRLWIYDRHEPVVIEGSPAPEYVPHYLAAIAVTFNRGCLGILKNSFFLVTDNGYQIQYHGYYPYWKSYNFWNLHYGWKVRND